MQRLEKTVDGHTSSLAVAHSPEEYAEYLESIPSEIYCHYYSDRSHFKEAIIQLRTGDISLAAKADKLMDMLREEGVFSKGIPMPSRAVAGAMAIMPLFEKGIPNCMINRDTSQMRGLNAPLNIYWDRFRSGVVGSRTTIIGSPGAKIGSNPVEARGIAITAFVMAMAKFRPVNLYMVNTSCPDCARQGEMGIYGGLIRMETQPLDLARATWMFTNRNFSEDMPWCAMRHQFQLTTGRPSDYAYGPIRLRYSAKTPEYGEQFRQILDMKRDDILLYGMTLNDPLSYLDPVAWVKRMIKEHTERQATTTEMD